MKKTIDKAKIKDIARAAELRTLIKELRDEQKEVDAKIKKYVSENEFLDAGEYTLFYEVTERTTFNSTSFKKANPGLAKKFLITGKRSELKFTKKAV